MCKNTVWYTYTTLFLHKLRDFAHICRNGALIFWYPDNRNSLFGPGTKVEKLSELLILENLCSTQTFLKLSQYMKVAGLQIGSVRWMPPDLVSVYQFLTPFHNDWTWHCMWSIHCGYFTMKLHTREIFCSQKTYCSAYFNVGANFQLMRCFFLYYAETIITISMKLLSFEAVELN